MVGNPSGGVYEQTTRAQSSFTEYGSSPPRGRGGSSYRCRCRYMVLSERTVRRTFLYLLAFPALCGCGSCRHPAITHTRTAYCPAAEGIQNSPGGATEAADLVEHGSGATGAPAYHGG